ncbi:Nitrile-specifier protein 5 [Ceratocystis lukuohia]|uniref:Nitrile-specifier protein 5 n=1 Tax=Ceratocystis lukuohia TaxID=2019550 RepID=A0ABR4MUG9_9PEZI
MESFAALKRRTTDILQSLPQSLPHNLPSLAIPTLPALPTLPSLTPRDVTGSWEKINGVPHLARSSHSLDIVGGSAYIFGGELNAREPVDNAMHVIGLPYSGASADYYTIPAQPLAGHRYNEQVEQANSEGEDSKAMGGKEADTTSTPDPETSRSSQEDKPDSDADDTNEASATATPVDKEPKELAEIPLSATFNKFAATDKNKVIDDRPELEPVPAPRVGHATAVIGNRIFMFGGRGGPAMIPLDEGGRVWVFDTRVGRWTFLDPASPAPGVLVIPRPAPRSYHSAAAFSAPRDFKPLGLRRTKTWAEWAAGDSAEIGTPQSPIVGNIAANATDEDNEGFGTFIVHGGCLAGAGQRAADVWAFDVRSCVWTQLPAAPGVARGGTALCASGNRLFRFGGFDGKHEIGGQVDVLTLGEDHSGLEPVLVATTEWVTLSQPTAEDGAPLSQSPWPKARSVAKLVPVSPAGREMLVLLMGEGQASAKGHEGAGKFFSDVWVFQVPAAVKSGKMAEGKWAEVTVSPHDSEVSAELPAARGWIDAAPMAETEENGILIWGGLGEDNNRQGDGWIFRLH